VKGKRQDLSRTWNRFVKCLFAAEEAWEEHRMLLASTPKKEVEKLPLQTQKFLSQPFSRSVFSKMLPLLVNYWIVTGGLKTLLTPIESIEKGVKEEIMEKIKKVKKEAK